MTRFTHHHEELHGLADAALLEDWRAGNRDAGHVLIDRHYDDVHAYVRKKVASDAAAADVVQDVFETAVRKRDKIASGFRAYAYCTAKLKVLELRRAQDRSFHELPGSSQLGHHARGASSMLDGVRAHDVFAKAFEQLDTHEQCIIVWKYLDERTQVELGGYLGLTKAQVNGQLNRARQRWRKLIDGLLEQTDASESQEQLRSVERWLELVYGVSSDAK